MAKRKNPRRPNFRFSDVGIPVGAVLSSKYDASVKCVVVRKGYVKFEEEAMIFLDATKSMLEQCGKEWPSKPRVGVSCPRVWTYQGRPLDKYYEERYPRGPGGWQEGEEEISEEGVAEGAVRQRRVNWYERDPRNRKAAIKKHGVKCFGCGLKMEERYGKIAKDFIHVHHVKPLSTVPEDSQPDIADLVPLCPNCHAVVHLGESRRKSRKKRHLTIKELQARIRKNQKSSQETPA